MFERLTKDARAAVLQARSEARALGAHTLEAEHLLLGLAGQPGTAAARLLAEAGLGCEDVRGALDRELTRSLEAVGVPAGAFGSLPAPVPMTGEPRWGTSAKVALSKALGIAQSRRDRRIEPAHILLAVLRARGGTVPRALAAADVDVAALVARIEAALDAR